MDSLRCCFIKEQLDLLNIDEHLTRLAPPLLALLLMLLADDELLLFVFEVIAVAFVKVALALVIEEAELLLDTNGVPFSPMRMASDALFAALLLLLMLARGSVVPAGIAAANAAATLEAGLPTKEPIKVDVMLDVEREMVSLNSFKSSNLEPSFLAGES